MKRLGTLERQRKGKRGNEREGRRASGRVEGQGCDAGGLVSDLGQVSVYLG